MIRGRWGRLTLVAALALAGAGCVNETRPTATNAYARNATFAFESIDGPPPAVFQRLVRTLSAEAQTRQVAVVSREGRADYRIRGYLAAHVERGTVSIAWVWDVYDGQKRRALRIAGEEPGTRRSSDAWSAADDAMVGRIARASLNRLVAFLDAGGAPGEPTGTPDDATGPVAFAGPVR